MVWAGNWAVLTPEMEFGIINNPLPILRKHQKGSSLWSRKESGRMGIAQKMQITRNPSACKVWHAYSKRLHHKQRWLTEEQPRWASLPMENG